jgi:short-subunit dehydrogenase involved in D-alanine esterification of teichoic acids
LITGGSSGIGLALAKVLVPTNTVVIAGRDPRKLERAKASVPDVHTIRLDVRSETEARAAMDWMADHFRGIDLLINSAGVLRSRTLETTPDGVLAEEIETNFAASARMTRVALPLLRQSSDSAVVFFSSALALGASPGLAIYAATKAAVHALARSLRAELRGTVKVFDVVPPWVDTELAGTFGRDRILPAQVADAIVRAFGRDQFDVYIGQIKAFSMISRFVPPLADIILTREVRP